MAYEYTLAIAQSYLQKHMFDEQTFGWKPFLETGRFRLGVPKFNTSGRILIIADGRPLECRSMAVNLCLDMLRNNPELTPRIMTSIAEDIHNWVEISDPSTGKIIQIDPTPWYATLNYGYNGKETAISQEELVSSTVSISKYGGIPLSVKVNAEESITTYLAGYLPRLSLEERVNGSNVPTTPSIQNSVYQFSITIVKNNEFGSKDKSEQLSVVFEISDLSSFKREMEASFDIDHLINSKVLKVGLFFHPSIPILWVKSFDILRQLSVQNSDLFSELERNLPALIEVLKKSEFTLTELGTGNRVSVSNGVEELAQLSSRIMARTTRERIGYIRISYSDIISNREKNLPLPLPLQFRVGKENISFTSLTKNFEKRIKV